MSKGAFDIEKFNIISDDDNYYFFRALNMGDNKDIEDKIILDENSRYTKIRTDRSRYDGTPLYNENDELSLEQIFDHIKMHHRTDTNCISLTTNANVALMYGRGFYKDKYILVKVPKEEFGKNIVVAGEYIIDEINKRINSFIENNSLSDEQKYYIDAIDNASTQKMLDELIDRIKNTKKSENQKGIDEECIMFNYGFVNSIYYSAFDNIQSLEKNKMIAKLKLIDKNIITNGTNNQLIETLGRALSSLEVTHYNNIRHDMIIDISKDEVDLLSLIQQAPLSVLEKELVDKVKIDIVNYFQNKKLKEFKYEELNSYSENELNELYILSKKNMNFNEFKKVYKKIFYLAKSLLRVKNGVDNLKKVIVNDSKYELLYDYLLNNTYGIEPVIFSQHNFNNIKTNNFVSLNFKENEMDIFNYVKSLKQRDLLKIINNDIDALYLCLDKFQYYAPDKNLDGRYISTRENIEKLCISYNIDITEYSSLFDKSYDEVYAKIMYLTDEDNSLNLFEDGRLNEIFFMADANMKVKYDVNLKELIDKYVLGISKAREV